jgi:hypothetical protein
MRRWVITGVLLLALASALAGCGGSGSAGPGGSSGTGGSGSSGVSISAITGPNHLQIGVSSPATYIYTASVTGSTNTEITWSVSNSSLATIDASTGVATPSSTNTGTVTITATAAADTTKSATLEVNVVDWILVGPQAYITDSSRSFYTSLLPINANSIDEYCSWSHDHLGFVCSTLTYAGFGPFSIFKTDGTAAGTVQTATINLAPENFWGIWDPPHFSPDGSKIIFTCLGPGANGPGSGPCVVNSDGSSAPVLLATDPDMDFESSPRFSPDGTQILFVLNNALWIMNADGSNQRQLFAAPSTNGVFSPDGTLIYFNGTLPNGQGGVIRANSDGSDPVVIVDASAGYQVVDVSPNGQSLLLQAVGNFTANADGTGIALADGINPGSWY